MKGREVLITGGSSGIGLAAAKLFSAEGARVTITGRDESKLRDASAVVGPGTRTAVLDVTDADAVERFFSGCDAVDDIVACASAVVFGPVREMPLEAYRALVDSKQQGQFLTSKYGAPMVRKGGSITLFSGVVSQKPMPGGAAYASVGAATEALARILALELAPVRVNTVVPGIIDTPAWDALMPADAKAGFFADVAGKLPVGRIGRPEDVADAVAFLVRNEFITGTTVIVDGGHRLI